eukprot:TRINITY_DN1385_c4_g1_i1.p1 TRINITY_DN1385_c4_g1~~TRINITY_DN1385_c4_g1_i1.p1  ORF type:complete len:735 (+),score=132.90 TRINITY_DN1385_c4_g1_i1:226-2205(+)
MATAAMLSLGNASDIATVRLCLTSWQFALRMFGLENSLSISGSKHKQRLAQTILAFDRKDENTLCLACFNSWLSAVQQSRIMRQAHFEEKLRWCDKAEAALMGLSKGSNATQVQICWSAWCKNHEAQLHKRRIARTLMTFAVKDDSALCSTCFSSWLTMLNERKQITQAQHQEKLQWCSKAESALMGLSRGNDTAQVQICLTTWYLVCKASQHEAALSARAGKGFDLALMDGLQSSQFALLLLCISAWQAEIFEKRIRALQLLDFRRRKKTHVLSHLWEDECRFMQLRSCFGVWSREAHEASGRAKRSELAVEALARFCKQGSEVLKDPAFKFSAQKQHDEKQTSRALVHPQPPNSNHQLVEAALKGCASVDHLRQMQKQAQTLAWRCSRDILEMMGDRETRYLSSDAKAVDLLTPLPALPASEGIAVQRSQPSMGGAALALAEAYKAETRRLARVQNRLVGELEPLVAQLQLGIDDAMVDARHLLTLLLSTSPPAPAGTLALPEACFHPPDTQQPATTSKGTDSRKSASRERGSPVATVSSYGDQGTPQPFSETAAEGSIVLRSDSRNSPRASRLETHGTPQRLTPSHPASPPSRPGTPNGAKGRTFALGQSPPDMRFKRGITEAFRNLQEALPGLRQSRQAQTSSSTPWAPVAPRPC